MLNSLSIIYLFCLFSIPRTVIFQNQQTPQKIEVINGASPLSKLTLILQ
jgi:hypothetical protein